MYSVTKNTIILPQVLVYGYILSVFLLFDCNDLVFGTTKVEMPSYDCVSFHQRTLYIDAVVIQSDNYKYFKGLCRYSFSPLDSFQQQLNLFRLTISNVSFTDCNVFLKIYYDFVSIDEMNMHMPDLIYSCNNNPKRNPLIEIVSSGLITVILDSQYESKGFSFNIQALPYTTEAIYSGDDDSETLYCGDSINVARSLRCDNFVNCEDESDEWLCTHFLNESFKIAGAVLFVLILCAGVICCLRRQRRPNARGAQHTIVTEAGVPLYTPPNTCPQSSYPQNQAGAGPLQPGYPASPNPYYGFSQPYNQFGQPTQFPTNPPPGFYPPNYPMPDQSNEPYPPPYAPPSYEESAGTRPFDCDMKKPTT